MMPKKADSLGVDVKTTCRILKYNTKPGQEYPDPGQQPVEICEFGDGVPNTVLKFDEATGIEYGHVITIGDKL